MCQRVRAFLQAMFMALRRSQLRPRCGHTRRTATTCRRDAERRRRTCTGSSRVQRNFAQALMRGTCTAASRVHRIFAQGLMLGTCTGTSRVQRMCVCVCRDSCGGVSRKPAVCTGLLCRGLCEGACTGTGRVQRVFVHRSTRGTCTGTSQAQRIFALRLIRGLARKPVVCIGRLRRDSCAGLAQEVARGLMRWTCTGTHHVQRSVAVRAPTCRRLRPASSRTRGRSAGTLRVFGRRQPAWRTCWRV